MMPEYHIYLGADHRGFEKKEALFELIKDCHENVIVEDLGAENYDEGDDFNDPAIAVCKAVLAGKYGVGVLICGSAHGMAMQANRFKGIRAINAMTEESVKLGREEDHANVLCLSGDKLDVEKMEKLVKAFCHTRELLDERYTRRVKRLDEAVEDDGKFKLGLSLSLGRDHDEDEDEEE